MIVSIPFLISAGARPFKWFHVQTDPSTGQPLGDPVDVQALGRLNVRCEIESERPECLEVQADEISPVSIDHNMPLGMLIPLSPGGPFRVSARLVNAMGETLAAGGFLAYVVNDTSEIPKGDLTLALGQPMGDIPERSLIEVVGG